MIFIVPTEKGKTMYSIFSFSAIYRTHNGRERTPADMLECVRLDNNKTFFLTVHWGDYRSLHDVTEFIKHGVPQGTYQHYIIGYDPLKHLFEHAYDGIVVYEDNRPITVYGR